MQIYKQYTCALVCALGLTVAGGICAAENSDIFAEAPAMPSVSAPSMPSVGGNSEFYRPSIPYVPSGSRNAPAAQDGISSAQQAETVSAPSENAEIKQSVPDMRALVPDMLGGSLSAGGGTQGNLLSLLGISSAMTGVQQPAAVPVAADQLQALLDEIAALQREQQSPPAGKAEYPRSCMLRFKINGQDILSSCSNIIVSSPTKEGAFLVTGEYRQAQQGESFYFLFSPVKETAERALYTVTAAVVQDTEDKTSLLYKMAENGPIPAEMTGNLVSLHSTDPDWRIDMLLDIRM